MQVESDTAGKRITGEECRSYVLQTDSHAACKRSTGKERLRSKAVDTAMTGTTSGSSQNVGAEAKSELLSAIAIFMT